MAQENAMRFWSALATIVVVSACVAAPEKAVEQGSGEPVPGGTVVIGTLSDVQTWNPYLSEDFFTDELLGLLFPSLAVEQPDYRDHPPSFAPSLARSRSWSDDHLTLTLQLEPDAVWSDGVPVTAADVVFTWRSQTSPELAWPYGDIKSSIESVEAVGAKTVRVRFARSYPYQLMDLNEGPIIPAHAWSTIPWATWSDVDWSKHLVTVGPFQLADHIPQQEIVFQRAPRYYKPQRPLLDSVVWRVIPSQLNLLTQLRTGAIDFMKGIPPREARRVADDPDIRLISFSDRGYVHICWNLRRPLLADVRVRRALAYAIDRETIIDVAYQGYAKPSAGPVLSDMWAFNHQLEQLDHSPDKARQLLADAGWSDQDGDGTLDRNGVAFKLEILANSENQIRQDICLLVQKDLAKVGVEVAPRFVEWGTLLALRSKGEYDGIVNRWIEPTQVDLYEVWHSAEDTEASLNYGGYANPEVDRLIAQAEATSEFTAQKPLFDRIQELIVADQPYAFLAEGLGLDGLRFRVHGAIINEATPYFNLEDWYVNMAPPRPSQSP
jgi:peptide/nickel transport system substrate-binding protein